jgi:hypothetical protein
MNRIVRGFLLVRLVLLGAAMIVCEYWYRDFNSRGSDDYVRTWAAQVDRMAAEGWSVLECYPDRKHPGSWTTVLIRPQERPC